MNIKKGDKVKTTHEFKQKLYEPLFSEEILEGVVLSIDSKDVATIEIKKSSCSYSGRFNPLTKYWKSGAIQTIGLGWLELAE